MTIIELQAWHSSPSRAGPTGIVKLNAKRTQVAPRPGTDQIGTGRGGRHMRVERPAGGTGLDFNYCCWCRDQIWFAVAMDIKRNKSAPL